MARDPNIVKEVFGRDYFEIHPAKTALLVVDMQNSFVEEGAWFEAPHGRAIIPAVNKMIRYCRSEGIPVIYTQSDHSYPGGGLILDRYPVIKETKELWKGDHSFDLYRELDQPTEKDLRVVKHKYDAFHETDLDRLLRNMGIDTVIVTGVATEVCCESTTRSAFFHDYKVVFTKDGTAAFDPAVQESTCARMNHLFARSMSVDETIEELRSKKPMQKAA